MHCFKGWFVGQVRQVDSQAIYSVRLFRRAVQSVWAREVVGRLGSLRGDLGRLDSLRGLFVGVVS